MVSNVRDEDLGKLLYTINELMAHPFANGIELFDPVYPILDFLDELEFYATKYRVFAIYFKGLSRSQRTFIKRLASIGFNKYERERGMDKFTIFSERGYKRGEQAFVSIVRHYLGVKPEVIFGDGNKDEVDYFVRVLDKAVAWRIWFQLSGPKLEEAREMFIEFLKELSKNYPSIRYCVSLVGVEVSNGEKLPLCEADKSLKVGILAEKD